MRNNFIFNKYQAFKLRQILFRVNRYKEQMAKLSDARLQSLTNVFQQRIAKGESLDKLLPMAFAAIREADKRILGLFPFDVQVMGAIALHQGRIIEMKTGEGKTLTATMPLYLNALTGKGAIIVTTNAYLSRRDADEMGKVYEWMGLTVGVGVKEASSKDEDDFKVEEKQKIYESDIVYTSSDKFGFDYLIENLAMDKKRRFLREFNYVIVDEADAVLLDNAQMPLVISGTPRVQSNLYPIANRLALSLKEEDYEINDEKTACWITPEGVNKIQKYFKIGNLYDPQYFSLNRHINLALRAQKIVEKNKDYVVEDEEVKLLSRDSGRVSPGNKLQGGNHQAIEEKEGVKLSPENRAMGSVTYQSLFGKFKKISGMTGTAMVVSRELYDTYKTNVVKIPTNEPMIRKDYPDKVYPVMEEKIAAVIDKTKEVNATGRPVLIVTASVDMSNRLSNLLLYEGIAHSVLNAFNVAKEAEIIKEAGAKGAVTIATQMAGRGTDIRISDEVIALGGLMILGAEKLPNKRMELQIRGRSGRQGNPGDSIFYLTEDDEVLEKWGTKKFHEKRKKLLESGKVKDNFLEHRKAKRILARAQKANDDSSKSSRKSSTDFDEIVDMQRQIIYKERDRLILKGEIVQEEIEELANEVVSGFLRSHRKELNSEKLDRFIYDNLSYNFSQVKFQRKFKNRAAIKDYLMEIFKLQLESKKNQLENSEENFSNYLRSVYLKALDIAWIEEVDYLNQLKTAVSNRAAAQKNPVYEFQREAMISYNKMKEQIYHEVVRYAALSVITKDNKGQMLIHFA